MHELSISLKTIDLVSAQAKSHNVNKVVAITLSVGALSCIEPEALMTGLEFASRETVAEGAKFNIEMVPATATCLDCGKHNDVKSHMDACSHCGSHQLQIETGEELKVKHIEVE
ncbi:hydrogenase maturation nickel metallochaperone HypA [Vibrio marisflavi]|uniref:Hydrogenase maturation factor HypA n=1 Tax=Vibrio marisflavi CECT 7928 TaxID=634439 RepID=A0ABM9A674_9VIBR|nr:hydrogenase maturation nickel metallochaperone HypA [Vibrio marisflavi]CAH0540468.1 Hydrogenase maturation factor HybF [Vibrio marisflavi CECT 7928]